MTQAAVAKPAVAILLPTFNSSRFIAGQLASLLENDTPFRLHWLDDHSRDDTCEIVLAQASATGMDLTRWNCPERLGVPAAFFQLLEAVDADIYLFCDHDDLWQPGKIDATVAALRSGAALCFSEPLVFDDADPHNLRHYFAVAEVDLSANPTRSFWSNPAVGNTIGFTRAVRELYLATAEIARRCAYMHDWWMYLLARCMGTARFMPDVPTTLYRQHGGNVFGARGAQNWSSIWARLQVHRYKVARQARGFIEAGPLLPPLAEKAGLLEQARLFAAIDRRQSLRELAKLLQRRALPPGVARKMLFLLSNLLSDGRPSAGRRE